MSALEILLTFKTERLFLTESETWDGQRRSYRKAKVPCEPWELKFDGNASTVACTDTSKCLCKTDKYFLKTSGTCDYYVMTQDECQKAAHLASSSTLYTGTWDSWSPGCFLNSANKLHFNLNLTSTADCSDIVAQSGKCICKRCFACTR